MMWQTQVLIMQSLLIHGFKISLCIKQKLLPATFLLLLLQPLFAGEACYGIPDPTRPHLKVTVIDVWQGDCILLELPNGRKALIDAGEGGTGLNSFDAPRIDILPYMKRNNITRTNIQFFLFTHPHSDHIGGAAQILKKFSFKRIYDSGMNYATSTYINLLKDIKKQGLPYIVPKIGDALDWDPKVKITVLNSGSKTEKNANNNSIVLHIVYSNFSILLTGDAEKKIEYQMIKSGYRLDSTILKACHHGSSTSSSEAFLFAVHPKDILISVGLNNKFGLPAQAVIDLFYSIGASVWRTDRDGDIQIITDGNAYSITTEKGESRP